MTRATAWLDRDQQRKDAYNDILAESDQSVNVYRLVTDESEAGFRKEVDEPTKIGTIVVRIDRAKKKQPVPNQDDANETPLYTALTGEIDVILGDIWQAYDLGGQKRYYEVVRREAIEAGTAVWLQEVRKLRWPLGD